MKAGADSLPDFYLFLHKCDRFYDLKSVLLQTVRKTQEDKRRENIWKNFERKKGFLCDMDGVIYHGNRLLPGVKEFVDWLYKEEKEFLFITNSSMKSPQRITAKIRAYGS